MKTVTFDITNECNLHCKHCSSAKKLGTARVSNFPSYNNYNIAFRRLSDAGAKYLHFLGGEPTIIDNLEKIISIAKKNSLTVGMNTNGIAISQERLDKLFDAGLSRLVLSIDGPTELSHNAIRGIGTFEKVIQTAYIISKVKQQREHNIVFAVQTTLTTLWLEEISKIFHLCNDIGVDELIIKEVGYSGRAKTNWELLSIPDADIMQCALSLCKHSAEVNFKVDLPFKPLVLAYFNSKLGLSQYRQPLSCEGGYEKLHCFVSGHVVPCVPFMELRPDLLSSSPNIYSEDNKLDIFHNYCFKVFENDIRSNNSLFENIEPCKRCSFLGRECTPCPLASLSNKNPHIRLCCVVEKKLGGL